MPNKSLFIGQSPLQILNLIEASQAYNKQGLFVIVYDSEDIRRQIESILEKLEIKDFDFIKRNTFFRMTFPMLLALKYSYFRGRVDTVFFGTYTTWASFLINLVKPKSHILIDDGQKTITVISRPDSVGLRKKSRQTLFSREYVQQAELFTFYDDIAREKGKQARANRLSWVFSRFSQDKNMFIPGIGPDDIVFIGTNICETYTLFEESMVRIMSQAKGRKLFYLMHRHDNIDEITELSKKLGFTPLRFDLPLELVFDCLWSSNKPDIWTFGSTATDTLQLLYDDLEISVYRLDLCGFKTKKLSSAFNSIYTYYQSKPRIRLIENL